METAASPLDLRSVPVIKSISTLVHVVDWFASVAMIKDAPWRDGATVDLAVVPILDGRTVPGGT